MKLESKKVYTVDGVEYSTKRDANIALSKKYLEEKISEGVESVIENSGEVIKYLRLFLKK